MLTDHKRNSLTLFRLPFDQDLNPTNWRIGILQDYGDIVLHIFSPEARSLYELERLWADALPVDWKAYLEHSESTPSS